MAAESTKPAADWERIELDYRAGVLSLREIAAPYAVTEGAIRKRAKRDAWERDLGPKIHAKADALVRKEAVRSEVRSGQAATERQIIEANAEQIAAVRSAHRGDIGRARALVVSLLGELEAQTGASDLFTRLGELMADPDDKGVDKLRDAYHKVIGLSGRVGNLKSLAEAMKNLVGLEREAYGIGAAEAKADPLDGVSHGDLKTLRDAIAAARGADASVAAGAGSARF